MGWISRTLNGWNNKWGRAKDGDKKNKVRSVKSERKMLDLILYMPESKATAPLFHSFHPFSCSLQLLLSVIMKRFFPQWLQQSGSRASNHREPYVTECVLCRTLLPPRGQSNSGITSQCVTNHHKVFIKE